MTAFRSHVKAHWHLHLTASSLLLALLLTLSGFGVGVTVARFARGGFRWSPPPPRVSIPRLAGGQLPRAWYLGQYVVRIHNQGASFSCVGQTLSTIEEIMQREAGRGARAFSAGYIYNQINGGVDRGSSYQDAYTVLTTQGDAPLEIFPSDGIDYLTQPTHHARDHATHWRFQAWRSIAVTDRYTMEYEIRQGRPLAIALPWRDSLMNLWGFTGVATQDAGTLRFWHSLTVIGYSPKGLTVLNSWGPAYGRNGRLTLSWDLVYDNAGQIVTANPIIPTAVKKAKKARTGSTSGGHVWSPARTWGA